MSAFTPSMTPADVVLLTAKAEQDRMNSITRLCMERCADTLRRDEALPASHERLPEKTRRCLDVCFQKFCDTADLVAAEKQAWEVQQLRLAQRQAMATTAVLGTLATTLTIGLGCYLFRGGDD
ncbi:DNAH1 [Symbiodinium sp. CCMP2592]|nr:DNAH1 [Symbiodinium sp. CCMP2592]